MIRINLLPKMCVRIQEIKKEKRIGDPFIRLYLGNTTAYVQVYIYIYMLLYVMQGS